MVVDDVLRVQICDWLAANGIDIKIIPLEVVMTLGEWWVSAHVYVRGPGGGLQLNERRDAPERVPRRFVLTVAPDGPVLGWLRAGCPSLVTRG